MKKLSFYVSELACAVFLSAVFFAGFSFFSLVASPEYVSLPGLVVIVLFLAAWVIDRILSARAMRMLFYVLVQIGLSAAGAFVMELFLKLPEGSVGLRIYSAVFYAITVIICASFAAKEVRQENLMHRFDVCLLLTSGLLILDRIAGLAAFKDAFGVMIAALVLLLIALSSLRSSSIAAEGSPYGKFLPVLILIIVVLIAVFAAVFLSGGARGIAGAIAYAFKSAWGAFTAFLSFVWSQWTRFCAWLASFFPEEGSGEIINIPEEHIDVITPVSEPSELSVIVLRVFTGIIILGLLFIVVRAISRIRLKKRSPRKISERDVVRLSKNRDGIKKLLENISSFIRYKYLCLRYRNTPAGLLALCESRVPKALKRGESESASQFLLRISGQKEDNEKEALIKLSGLVSRSFYSRENPKAGSELCNAIKHLKF